MPFDANAYPNTAGSIVNELLAVIANVDATSTDTGSIQVLGGIGVSGNVWANAVYANTVTLTGDLAVSGNLTADNIQFTNIVFDGIDDTVIGANTASSASFTTANTSGYMSIGANLSVASNASVGGNIVIATNANIGGNVVSANVVTGNIFVSNIVTSTAVTTTYTVPSPPSITAGSGYFGPTTKYFKLVAVSALGTSLPSLEVAVTTTGGFVLANPGITGATTYQLWISDVSGSYQLPNAVYLVIDPTQGYPGGWPQLIQNTIGAFAGTLPVTDTSGLFPYSVTTGSTVYTGSTTVLGGNIVTSNITVGNVTSGNITTTGALSVTGNISALANLFVTANVTVTGNLRVTGNTYHTGNIFFTNTTSLSYASNAVMPKSYTDAFALVFGI